MDKKTIVTILVFLTLQVVSFEVKSDVGFSSNFIEKAKSLGIDIKQNNLQPPFPNTPKKTELPSSIVKPKVLETPNPPIKSKVPDAPKVPVKSKVSKMSEPQIPAKPKVLEIPKLPVKPKVSNAPKSLPSSKSKQKVKSEKKNVKKHVIVTKKSSPETKKTYFVAPEEKINNQDFDEKAHYKREIYNYNETPPKFLIEQQNKGKNTHLPKFMMQEELSRLLFIAVNEENIGAIKTLLQRGANINAQDKNNKYTPLMYAVKDNKIDALRYLLVKGANPSIKGTNQMSALHLATILNRLKILKILLQSGADIFAKDQHYKTFYDYVLKDYLSIVINDIYETRKNANDALLDFCVLGSLRGVVYSLQNKADINTKNQDGDTPLILAVRYRHHKLVSYLLGAGADVTIKNKYNNDAATIARLNNYNKIYNIIETVKFNKQLYILGLVDNNIIPHKLTPSELQKLKGIRENS